MSEQSLISADVKNISMPRGKVSFLPFDDDGLPVGAEIDVGNCTSLDISNSPAYKEHTTSQNSLVTLDTKKIVDNKYTFKLVPEERSLFNMVSYFLGNANQTIESYSQAKGTLSSTPIRIYLDRWIDLGKKCIKAGSISSPSGIESDTGCRVDYENGLVMVKSTNGLGIADGDLKNFIFKYGTIDLSKIVFGTKPLKGFLRYRGTSPVGPRHSVEMWMVQITPDAAISMIKAGEYAGLSIAGDIFKDDQSEAHADNPYLRTIELQQSTADFSWVAAGKTVTMTNLCTLDDATYDIDWGDGSAHTTDPDGSHEYAEDDHEYQVTMTAVNVDGTSSKTKTVKTESAQTDDAELRYKCDEGAGTVAVNSGTTGTANNLTASDGTKWYVEGYELDGVSNLINSSPVMNTIQQTDVFTFGLKFKRSIIDEEGSNCRMLQFGKLSSSPFAVALGIDGNKLKQSFWGYFSPPPPEPYSSIDIVDIADTDWHHVVVIMKNGMYVGGDVYLDGVKVGYSLPWYNVCPFEEIKFGFENKMMIRDFRFYRRELTEQEIVNWFNS